MPLAVLRVDAGREIGAGHLARCIALGLAMEEDGWTLVLASTRASHDILPIPNWKYLVVETGDMPAEISAMISAFPEGVDLLILDHYRRGVSFEKALRSWASRILVIEDYPNRQHDCDVLVDPTPLRDSIEYARFVPARSARFVGGAYAPLRPMFARARWRRPRDRDDVRSIHLSLGATDPGGGLGSVLEGIEASGFDGDIVVSLSPAARGYGDVCARISNMGGVILPPNTDIASAMSTCDLAIGAGGVGMLERACLGLPQILVEVAANQRSNLAAAEAAEAGIVVRRPDARTIARAVHSIISSHDQRLRMARNSSALCDGLGASRVAMELLGEACRLRLAVAADCATIHEWQSHPTTRRFARDTTIPEFDTHKAWMDAKLADRRCIFLIMEAGDTSCASVRLDWLEDQSGFEVSLVVAPSKRGRGYGARALSLARRLVSGEDLLAHVKQANEASMRSFARAGYIPAGRPDWYISRGRGS